MLGVPRDASFADIRAAYRAAVLRAHPDKLMDDDRDGDAAVDGSSEFLRVQAAWAALRDGDARAAHDEQLRVQQGTHVPRIVDVVQLSDMVEASAAKWTTPCRCGDVYEVTHTDMALARSAGSSNLTLACASCSLCIQVDITR